MVEPYYDDGTVTLYLGDCREIDAWITADMLVTDPPYGIGWKRGAKRARGDASRPRADAGHKGIAGDADTSSRDTALAMWGERPAVVFGSFYAPQPVGVRHVLVYQKPVDAGVVGSTTGFRRDVEPVYLVGAWPKRTARWGSVVTTATRGAGYLAARSGHPHAKPGDVMEFLIDACPPGAVADPFAGSGTTLVAARNLGRRAIGVEIDEAYCETIALRLDQQPLFTAGGPIQWPSPTTDTNPKEPDQWPTDSRKPPKT